MTLIQLREAYNKVLQKQQMKETLYQNYLIMKSSSNKKEDMIQILQQGIDLYNRGLCTEAYRIFSLAINVEADADAYHNRGTACMDIGKFEQAIGDFTAAIIFCPTYSPPYLNRALCISQVLSDNDALDDLGYIDIKKIAIQDFKKAIELGSNTAEAYLAMIE